MVVANGASEADIAAAFATFASARVSGVIVNPDPFLLAQRKQIVALAAQHRMASIFHLPEPVAAGGLMSYGARFPEAHRTVGLYAGRILKGAKPADLPVPQPTKFDLVIDLKAARELGLDMPAGLLARADEVIE
jgi:putative ABC transport system substrate-binding protein